MGTLNFGGKLNFKENTLKRKENHDKRMKVLIADDDLAIHQVTKLVLQEIVFNGEKLEFISTYSGKETMEVLKNDNDIAVILLDVVMEEEDSGLKVAKFIREELKNQRIRIILRTGQPGSAPEKDVINNYEINDYKEKTELTFQKLYTCVLSSLRSYRDLKTIEKSKENLEKIIIAGRNLFMERSLENFTSAVLKHMSYLLKMQEEEFYLCRAEYAEENNINSFYIIACDEGKNTSIKINVEEKIPPEILSKMENCLKQKKSVFLENEFIAYVETKKEVEHIIYFRGTAELLELDKEMLQIFSNDVVATYENLLLNKLIINTQKELIYTLGDVVESRSKDTANHVRRVTEYAVLIAQKLGLSKKDVELIKMATPVHDIGKIAIADTILNKPGKLTAEEFEKIKPHTLIGAEIMKNTDLEIFQAGAIIALNHHERWDGSGYPNGKKGEEIHIYGRITALADVFDALTHKRVYKEAWPMEEVLEFIKNGRGSQFDPTVVDIALENMSTLVAIKEKFKNI